MKVIETRLRGVLLVQPDVFTDARGAFFESWSHRRYRDAGILENFVQDNFSSSAKGVLRGLHFQHPNAQAKLVTAIRGEVYDVAVDVRAGSPTFGQWVGVTLSGLHRAQLYIPAGFAHGFQCVSEDAIVHYKCSRNYDPNSEHSLLWSDEIVGIDWPHAPILSPKDADGMRLRDFPEGSLPAFAMK